jgi:carboxyl-terminal processing protease
MNRSFQKIAVAILLFLVPTGTSANSAVIAVMETKASPFSRFAYIDRSKTMDVKAFFTVAFEAIAEAEGVPKSSAYVRLNYPNVFPGSELYAAMQKGVYLDLVENSSKPLPLKKTATEGLFIKVLERVSGEKIAAAPNKPLTYGVLFDTLADLYETGEAPEENVTDVENFGILNDAYLKLKNDYFDASKADQGELVRGAIKGMANSVDDKHTVYFPPVETKSFEDELSGEFEGIGAYVDMQTPGVLKIISPISGSPAERAGLKSGDIIRKVNDFEITEKVSLEMAVSKIKGPAGTEVTLSILRGEETILKTVKREKITIDYVEYKKLPSGIVHLKITMFGEGTLVSFAKAAEWISKNATDTNKLIIDLRNNPGGSLDEVAAILSYFVPKGDAVVKIRYRSGKSQIVSAGSDFPLSGRKIAILVNGGSASASEIMAGTIKDYFPATVIVGEKTYGKGSVQNFFPYADGSSLKYTVAKWFTGKTETGIDGVGISPDIEVFAATGSTSDTQLARAEEALQNR